MTTIQYLIDGLVIFERLNGDVCAEHDVIHASPGQGIENVPEREASRLVEMGWMRPDEDCEGWRFWV